MINKMFKLKPISAAIMGAAILSASNASMAAPVNAEVSFTCPFPLIGDQTIIAQISADYPTEILLQAGQTTAELPAIDIDAITIVPDRARQGLGFVGATTITGTATSINTFRTASGDINSPTQLTVIDTTIPTNESGPFNVPAQGVAPAQVFDESHIGTVNLTLDDLILNLTNLKADGSVAPAPVGTFTADCNLDAGQNNVLASFVVKPANMEADIEVSTTDIAFGEKLISDPAVQQTVSITNNGGSILGISSIDLSGSNDFTETNNCTTLAGGESCVATVTYTPSATGPQNASLVINSTDPDEASVSVAISATGTELEIPKIQVTQTSIDFGSVTQGDVVTETIVINNVGTAPLSIFDVAANGSAEFTTTNSCSFIDVANSCSETVTYTASALGASTGNVVISSDDADAPSVSVGLNGFGVAPIDECEANPALPQCQVDTCETDPTLPGCDVIIDDPCELDPSLPECDTGSNDVLVDVALDVEGNTYIAANGGSLPLNGQIQSSFNLTQGSFTGDLHLDGTQGSFEIIKGWSRYLATAHVEFESVGITEGTLIDGALVATSTAYVKIPKVTKTLLGLFDWKIGGGEDCRTKEPVTFTITSADGEYFDALQGGTATGTYALPELENCGALTKILSGKLSGAGNTIELTLTPNFN